MGLGSLSPDVVKDLVDGAEESAAEELSVVQDRWVYRSQLAKLGRAQQGSAFLFGKVSDERLQEWPITLRPLIG